MRRRRESPFGFAIYAIKPTDSRAYRIRVKIAFAWLAIVWLATAYWRRASGVVVYRLIPRILAPLGWRKCVDCLRYYRGRGRYRYEGKGFFGPQCPDCKRIDEMMDDISYLANRIVDGAP